MVFGEPSCLEGASEPPSGIGVAVSMGKGVDVPSFLTLFAAWAATTAGRTFASMGRRDALASGSARYLVSKGLYLEVKG